MLTREPSDAELLKGITKPKSHLRRACDKLGIEVIAARSPQAKGRVERNHGLDQDRLIVRIGLDGKVSILWKGKPLPVEELPLPKKGRPDSHAA